MAEGLYFTRERYIEAWGEDELDRVTGDEEPGAFERAVADASADMDLYLSGRYPLPFAEPIPRALLSIGGALTREKLHGSYPTETVTEEADRARKMLADLGRGLANLILDTGGQVESAGSNSDAIMWSAPPRVFTAERLSKF